MKRIAKQTLTILLVILLIGGTAACALSFAAEAATYSGECGENGDAVTWSLDTATGIMTISGTGAMRDFTWFKLDIPYAPWPNFGNDIQSVVIEDGVTSVGGSAFERCNNLTRVTIADSVTQIGVKAIPHNTGVRYCLNIYLSV